MNRLFSSILFLETVGFLLNIVAWLIIYLKIRPTSEIVPLHYNIFYGVDYAGSGYYIYLIPLVGIIILLGNFILYRISKRSEDFAGKMLVAVSVIVQVFILIAVLFLKSKIVL
jgi:hypothetical protein